mgnify:CR=1 FL=1
MPIYSTETERIQPNWRDTMDNRTWEELNRDINQWHQRQHTLRLNQWQREAVKLEKEALENVRQYLDDALND